MNVTWILAFLIMLVNCKTKQNKTILNPSPRIDQQDEPPSQPKDWPPSAHKNLILLPMHDQNCTADNALSDMGVVKVWVDVAGSKVQRSFDLTGLSGKLSTSFVKAVYLESSAIEANNQFRDQKKGRRFYACSREYPRYSLENAALAAFVAVQTTIDFIHRLDPKISYQAIRLHIQAHISSSTGLLRNNAYHYGPSIWFVPLTHNMYTLLGNTFFWEEMAVGAHEAGHHLYDTVIFKSSAVQALGVKPVISHLQSAINLTHLQREFVALNESTADLVSFYRWGAGSDPLGDLKFGDAVMVRNPKYAQTDSGQKKILSRDIFDTFSGFGLTENPMGRFDPHDVHAIGSIFAHWFDQLLADEVGASDTDKKAKARMKALLDITLDFKNNLGFKTVYHAGMVFESYLNAAIKHFQRDNALTDFQCDILKKGFPFFSIDKNVCS